MGFFWLVMRSRTMMCIGSGSVSGAKDEDEDGNENGGEIEMGDSEFI